VERLNFRIHPKYLATLHNVLARSVSPTKEDEPWCDRHPLGSIDPVRASGELWRCGRREANDCAARRRSRRRIVSPRPTSSGAFGNAARSHGPHYQVIPETLD